MRVATNNKVKERFWQDSFLVGLAANPTVLLERLATFPKEVSEVFLQKGFESLLIAQGEV